MLLDRNSYNKKVKNILQNDIFRILPRDPTRKVERKIATNAPEGISAQELPVASHCWDEGAPLQTLGPDLPKSQYFNSCSPCDSRKEDKMDG